MAWGVVWPGSTPSDGRQWTSMSRNGWGRDRAERRLDKADSHPDRAAFRLSLCKQRLDRVDRVNRAPKPPRVKTQRYTSRMCRLAKNSTSRLLACTDLISTLSTLSTLSRPV